MPKGREDLTGRMFGRWKVIGPAEDYIRPVDILEFIGIKQIKNGVQISE